MKEKGKLESLFHSMLNVYLNKHGSPEIPCIREYRFGANYVGLGPGVKQRLKDAWARDCRFDFAFPEQMVAVEIHGGEWNGGRHVNPQGFINDRKKMNQAVRMGWKVLEFTGTMLKKEPDLCMFEFGSAMGVL